MSYDVVSAMLFALNDVPSRVLKTLSENVPADVTYVRIHASVLKDSRFNRTEKCLSASDRERDNLVEY